MTLISPSKTSFLQNVELNSLTENNNKFDSLFSEQYISEETFTHLNLSPTFSELKYFAKQDDFSSIDLLFTLTSRRDEIGKAATKVLMEIKTETLKGSYDREVFNLHCEKFYQQCRLNEISHRSPQLFQLSIEMLTTLIDIKLTGQNHSSNQDIFTLIQILQKKSNKTQEYIEENLLLASSPVSTTEEESFIVISNTDLSSSISNNIHTETSTQNGHHIMDSDISNINPLSLSPYLLLSDSHQQATEFSTVQGIDPLSQSRHEFIEFLQHIRKSTNFSDNVMKKLIHKWDVNNPIFIPKPEIEATYSTTKTAYSHWQSRLSNTNLKGDESVKKNNNIMHNSTIVSPSLLSKTPDFLKPDNIEKETPKKDIEVQTTTMPLSEKLSSWFSTFLSKK
ncbi:hypothetical protein [uncultured Shewanella sp.]|uniref:hypothetical protein n=1 Tax=uncultured Shewanella sp. TaxID=173975 RepID=UPI00261B7C13|nr:hypothetical protein [uncultured Shewanella sp.]